MHGTLDSLQKEKYLIPLLNCLKANARAHWAIPFNDHLTGGWSFLRRLANIQGDLLSVQGDIDLLQVPPSPRVRSFKWNSSMYPFLQVPK